MMRSLRARLFLSVWPLFVLAIVVVGALVSRSARVELAQFEALGPPPAPARPSAGLAQRLALEWPTLLGAEGAARLQRLSAESGGTPLVLLDTQGRLVATSDPGLTPAAVAQTPGGELDLRRTVHSGGQRAVQRLLLGGTAVHSPALGALGTVYLLPTALPQPSGAQVMVAGIERSVWAAVLLACVLAAAGTWWLAYPVVAQVRRLIDAASRVQDKNLATRVRIGSHDELGTLERSFNAMAESLERAESAKRQLISDLAHELRTPLTNVIGQLEAMRDGLRVPDAAALNSTHEEALLLEHLIDELQELALADAGGLRFDIRPLDAGTELRRAAGAFQASTPGIELELPAAPVVVLADSRRLAQVLRNLLQNAVTHTPADGRIVVSLHQEGPRVVLAVADTGSGIAAEHLPLIWERFYRVDASRDRATGGMGLGLALTRRMVEGMGGSIAATSQPNVGTTITVRLPGHGSA